LVKLLVISHSYRRNPSSCSLPAIERYDGLFFRIARKYLGNTEDVKVLVMKDDLTLIDANKLLPYAPPEGENWKTKSISKESIEKARKKNEIFLKKKLKQRKYSEIYLAMGKRYAEALPDLSSYGLEVKFPIHGGIGPKAQALKEWFLGTSNNEG